MARSHGLDRIGIEVWKVWLMIYERMEIRMRHNDDDVLCFYG